MVVTTKKKCEKLWNGFRKFSVRVSDQTRRWACSVLKQLTLSLFQNSPASLAEMRAADGLHPILSFTVLVLVLALLSFLVHTMILCCLRTSSSDRQQPELQAPINEAPGEESEEGRV